MWLHCALMLATSLYLPGSAEALGCPLPAARWPSQTTAPGHGARTGLWHSSYRVVAREDA